MKNIMNQFHFKVAAALVLLTGVFVSLKEDVGDRKSVV